MKSITIVKMPVSLISTFIWVGFVCAISFMEAWLKFQAPGISVPLGLGIGRIVFSALNKVEWILAICIFGNLLLQKERLTKSNILITIPILLLITQTIWLLPALDLRAQLHIEGRMTPASNLHFVYVAMEVLKVAALFIFGVTLLKKYNNNIKY